MVLKCFGEGETFYNLMTKSQSLTVPMSLDSGLHKYFLVVVVVFFPCPLSKSGKLERTIVGEIPHA